MIARFWKPGFVDFGTEAMLTKFYLEMLERMLCLEIRKPGFSRFWNRLPCANSMHRLTYTMLSMQVCYSSRPLFRPSNHYGVDDNVFR